MKKLFLVFSLIFLSSFLYAGGELDAASQFSSFVYRYIDGDAIPGRPVRDLLVEAQKKNVYPDFVHLIGEKNQYNFFKYLEQEAVSEYHALYMRNMIQAHILNAYFKSDDLTTWGLRAFFSAATACENRGKRGGNAWIY